MNEIYWITRLDCINGWLIAFSIISGIVFAISLVPFFIYKSDKNEDMFNMWKGVVNKSAIVFFSCLPLSILTPTENEAMLIWGVGGTIDYIKDNETINQLPDKVVNALDAWVESLSNEEKETK